MDIKHIKGLIFSVCWPSLLHLWLNSAGDGGAGGDGGGRGGDGGSVYVTVNDDSQGAQQNKNCVDLDASNITRYDDPEHSGVQFAL